MIARCPKYSDYLNSCTPPEQKVLRVVGGAGTGKTQHAMANVALVAQTGIDPRDVGFVSFTRAARTEAATRAANDSGLNEKDFLDNYFRTVHSACYKLLGVNHDSLLTNNTKSNMWLTNLFGQKFSANNGQSLDDDEMTGSVSYCQPIGKSKGAKKNNSSPAQNSLELWNVARNRLNSLKKTWELAAQTGYTGTPWIKCLQFVTEYERQKKREFLLDFSDMLAAYAGLRFHLGADGDGLPENVTPKGLVPDINVWFHDEMQDASPLLGAAFHRLSSKAKWIYLYGDPFQAVHTWAGADPRVLMNWKISKQVLLNVSYRCPQNVLNIGENILRHCSDYFDRKMTPHASITHQATLHKQYYHHRFDTPRVDPTQSWLLLARTNFLAGMIATSLNANNVPFAYLKGNQYWLSPHHRSAIYAAMAIANNQPVARDHWADLVGKLPSKYQENILLTRGTKTRFKSPADSGLTPTDLAWSSDELKHWGATDQLLNALQTNKWTHLVPKAEQFTRAVAKYGPHCCNHPTVRVGTIHAAKGAEADNVFVLTSLSKPIEKALRHPRLRDAEHRVWYVAATRTKNKLVQQQKLKGNAYQYMY